MNYSQSERLHIVLDIIKKLKNYKLNTGNTVDLYNSSLCSFITDFKIITNKYIKEEKEYKVPLYFEEINKKPLFVIRI